MEFTSFEEVKGKDLVWSAPLGTGSLETRATLRPMDQSAGCVTGWCEDTDGRDVHFSIPRGMFFDMLRIGALKEVNNGPQT